ncbi:SemiSWEET family sugar transporter [Croceitalea rosinachiae]|uniref:SemiSWEET transporter n=1 Tax=Croceitalea rosinachiae TaxID=3075596 RepID=A0ABU3A8X2_9FLAO|nr:SemiSWEET transporter [Croceitalea sp. F388]MDT0606642.1 SemiSWEET transporter [Croceitalea sp. F388]
METIEIIGLIAATCTTTAFVPQVYKALKEKSTADISFTMYLVLFVGLILWLIYGIQYDSLAIILANAITAILVLIMLILKIKHK